MAVSTSASDDSYRCFEGDPSVHASMVSSITFSCSTDFCSFDDASTLMQLPHRLISRGSDVAVHEGLGSDRHSLPWITSAPNRHVSMASNAIHRPYTVLRISSTKVCACTVSVTYFDCFSSIRHARSAHLAPQAIRPTVQPIRSGSWAIHVVCMPTVVDAGGRKAASSLLLMQARRVKYSTTVIVL